MGMTFDATLKDMGRESPVGFLTTFDQAPTLPLRLLNVDLSTVTTAADLLIGLGDPLVEVVHLDFQSSAAAWKHADLLAYNALAYTQYHVPVHSIVVLLRPEAAHSNMNGVVRYAPRPGRGNMNFGYEVVPLWKRPAAELLAGDLGTCRWQCWANSHRIGRLRRGWRQSLSRSRNAWRKRPSRRG
jgi:hypothetical protein